MIDKLEDNKWIGFSHYKYFWKNTNNKYEDQFHKNVLKEIPESWNEYESILGEKFFRKY